MGVRRGLAAVVAAATLIGPAVVALAPSAVADDPLWLQRVNAVRVASGLSPVTANPAWVDGIAKHLTYLEKTPASYMTGQYANAHTENPQSPYYTPEGAQEGIHSDLAYGKPDDVAAVDSWLEAPFHAIGALRPEVQQVAFYRDPVTGDAGLDVISGLAQNPPPRTSPVLFPGNGSTFDLTLFGGENPDPTETCRAQHPGANYGHAALPLIALLPAQPSGVTATLQRTGDAPQSPTTDALCVVDSDTFVTSDSVYGPTASSILAGDHAVLLIARTRLSSGTYTATISPSGQPAVSWSFTIDPKALSPQVGFAWSCSYSAVASGFVRVNVQNIDEGAGASTYTVSVGSRTGQVTLPDGATGKVDLQKIAAGPFDVSVVGSDGTQFADSGQMPTCATWTGTRVRFVRLNHNFTLTTVLDNTRNLGAATFALRTSPGGTSKKTVAGRSRLTLPVKIAHHGTTTVTVTVAGHTVGQTTATIRQG